MTYEYYEMNEDIMAFLRDKEAVHTDDTGIPVYVVDANEAELINFSLATNANKEFEKSAPRGLYRGGAVVLVRWNDLTLAVYDDRYKWFKPFGGIAHFDEGSDLTKTGRRELCEEAFIFSLTRDARFLPSGVDEKITTTRGSLVTVQKVIETGEIKLIDYVVNEQNRSFEAVMEWEIDIPQNFSVSLEEDWWQGGASGIPVVALNKNGAVAGYFSGQQGFVPLPPGSPATLHPTLKKYLVP